jgi:hypothetical protein
MSRLRSSPAPRRSHSLACSTIQWQPPRLDSRLAGRLAAEQAIVSASRRSGARDRDSPTIPTDGSSKPRDPWLDDRQAVVGSNSVLFDVVEETIDGAGDGVVGGNASGKLARVRGVRFERVANGLLESTKTFLDRLDAQSENSAPARPPMERTEIANLLMVSPATRYQTGHDVALAILRGFASTYPIAVQDIRRRAAQAQHDFIRGTHAGSTPEIVDAFRKELIFLKWPIDQSTLDLTSILRPGRRPKMAWFPTVLEEQADQIQELVASSLLMLDRLRERIAALSHSISSAETNAVLQLASAEEERASRLQRSIGIVSAIFIAPALIAGFFGAVPQILENDSWARFALVVGTMIIAGELAWYIARRWLVAQSRSVLPTTGEFAIGVSSVVAVTLAIYFLTR